MFLPFHFLYLLQWPTRFQKLVESSPSWLSRCTEVALQGVGEHALVAVLVLLSASLSLAFLDVELPRTIEPSVLFKLCHGHLRVTLSLKLHLLHRRRKHRWHWRGLVE